jgi:glyoxylase-like metal-dependent hydrolase (beta-lactamase superfamily II)
MQPRYCYVAKMGKYVGSTMDCTRGIYMNGKFDLIQLSDRIYLMSDQDNATGYFVVGDDKVLVIDTMTGYDNINEVIKTITDLPVMVVNTHGHGDHVLGNVYFDEAFIHPDEIEIVNMFLDNPEFIEECEKRGLKMPPFQYLTGGELIDIGGATFDVVLLPGHTKGGLCLLYREERVLFTGDGINCYLWMQLDHSMPMSTLVESLENIMYLKDKADRILHGHATGYEDISLMELLYTAAKDLVEHPELADTDPDYNWFGGVDKQHDYADGKVICYSVKNLK